MPVAPEIASMLDALDAPSMLIRPDDMTVAAVNDAFAHAYGRFRFEGKKCWEALHRAGPCPKTGLICPMLQSQTSGMPVCRVEQTIYGSARVTELTVTARPVTAADGRPSYWLETLKPKRGDAEPFSRGTVGVSRKHAELMKELDEAAAHDEPYLIVGEKGLGKELYARTVHENSVRALRPFVVASGARLDAKQARKLLLGETGCSGLLQRAQGGTLFIDGLELMSGAALEVLEKASESGQAQGAAAIRFAAGSSFSPSSGETAGSALLSRFSAHCIHVAPLRERKQDIAPLAKFFLSGMAPVNTRTITNEAIDRLQGYDWPGNMHELREVLRRAAEAACGSTITSAVLPLPERVTGSFLGQTGEIIPLADIKDRYLLWAVENFRGSRSELALKLGISERTLYRLHAQSKSKRQA